VTFIVGGRLLEGHDKDREKGNYLVEEDDDGVGATFGVIFGNALARYDQKKIFKRFTKYLKKKKKKKKKKFAVEQRTKTSISPLHV
jgi:hypothetical protein